MIFFAYLSILCLLALRKLHGASLACLAFSVLLQRLLITASVTLIVEAFVRSLFSPGEDLWLVFWQVHLVWHGALVFWALLIRIALRKGLLLPDSPVYSCSQVITKG